MLEYKGSREAQIKAGSCTVQIFGRIFTSRAQPRLPFNI